MTAERVLFVNHTSRIAGAEMVLLDVVKAWPGAIRLSVRTGPPQPGTREPGTARSDLALAAQGSTAFRRDKQAVACRAAWRDAWPRSPSSLRSVARRHDVVYANSQKAFVVAAVATALSRRPLIWHLHDIIDAAHFGPASAVFRSPLANWRSTQRHRAFSGGRRRFHRRRRAERSRRGGAQRRRDRAGRPIARTDLRDALGLAKAPLIGVFSRLAPLERAARGAAGARPALTACIASSSVTPCSARRTMPNVCTAWSANSASKVASTFSAIDPMFRA